MEIKLEEFLDNDLVRCPISLEILRHPILASDGRHYELSMLYGWLIDANNQKRSPFSNQVITSVIYDTHLKQTLDALNLSDRYKDYKLEDYLNTLLSTINPIESPQMLYPKKSIALFNGCLITLLACTSTTLFHPAFLISALIGLGDYATRCSTNNRYSLFSLIEGAGRKIATPYLYAP